MAVLLICEHLQNGYLWVHWSNQQWIFIVNIDTRRWQTVLKCDYLLAFKCHNVRSFGSYVYLWFESSLKHVTALAKFTGYATLVNASNFRNMLTAMMENVSDEGLPHEDVVPPVLSDLGPMWLLKHPPTSGRPCRLNNLAAVNTKWSCSNFFTNIACVPFTHSLSRQNEAWKRPLYGSGKTALRQQAHSRHVPGDPKWPNF